MFPIVNDDDPFGSIFERIFIALLAIATALILALIIDVGFFYILSNCSVKSK